MAGNAAIFSSHFTPFGIDELEIGGLLDPEKKKKKTSEAAWPQGKNFLACQVSKK